MKIKETIERECCAYEDLKLYAGVNRGKYKNLKLWFCRHCGQIWYPSSVSDGAGGRDSVRERLEL